MMSPGPIVFLSLYLLALSLPCWPLSENAVLVSCYHSEAAEPATKYQKRSTMSISISHICGSPLYMSIQLDSGGSASHGVQLSLAPQCRLGFIVRLG